MTKTFIIDLNGKQSTVSIDRIKPAYLLADVTDHSDLVQTQTIIEKPVTAAPNPSIPYTTRYGRKFTDFEAFNEWKDVTEKETKSKFIVKRGATSLKKGKKHHFVRHRSGVYISKGLRHLKTQGSNKIDGYCPAEIKVFVSETGACSIKFCKTHLGHRNDIGHLSLTDFERQHIATKIASKIPFDEIRDSVTDSKLERIHLLMKKDV
ncbi:uncharacterized protein TNCV_2821081 [Trichonephila clavipes]|nr:uncharacterized protein TNCV_2821081 [Trichonephila clavipes]